MTFRLLFCLALFPLALPLAARDPLALRAGEQFSYRLSWGIFGRAAELTITAHAVTDAPETETRIVMATATRGLIRALYPFDGEAISYYDNASGDLLRAEASTITRTKETRATIVLDYPQAVGVYTDHLRPDRSLQVPLPTAPAADFITTMIQARHWDMAVGETREVAVLFDDEFYELTITAEGIETIKTPWGAQEALVLIPRMEENPKGMFKRGGEVRVWVARNAPRLPLRFEVKVAVGTALAVLTDYRIQEDPTEVAASVESPR